MHTQHASDRRGVSVIEILVSLGLLLVVVTAISTLIASASRAETVTTLRERALGHARSALETALAIQDDAFACTCATDACSVTTCTKASDGQLCTLPANYTSCWTEYPDTLTANTPLHLVTVGGAAQFAAGEETVPADAMFGRSLTIENIANNPSRKQITVTVTWNERGEDRALQVSGVYTAWKNEP